MFHPPAGTRTGVTVPGAGNALAGAGTWSNVGGVPSVDHWLCGHTTTNALPITFRIGT